MTKYLYLTLTLAFGLSIASCKQDIPQQETKKETPSSTTTSTPKPLTEEYWQIEGTNNELNLQQRFRFDFHADNTFTARYDERVTGSPSTASARAAKAEYYVYTGTYTYSNGKLTIRSVAFLTTQGVTDTQRTSEITQLAQALVGRVFQYNEAQRTLTLTQEKASTATTEETKDLLLIFTRPATPQGEKEESSDQASKAELNSILTQGQWVRDKFITGTPGEHQVRRHTNLTFLSNSSCRLEVITDDFSSPDSIHQGSRTRSYEGAYFLYEDGTVHLRFDSDTPLQTDSVDLGVIVFKVDKKQGRLLSQAAGEFQQTADASFRLTDGVWLLDDSDIENPGAPDYDYSDKQTSITFRPNGTYSLRFLQRTHGAQRNSLSVQYNNEYFASGTYSYERGIVKLLSYTFDGYGSKFAEYRRQHPEQDNAAKQSIAGLAFKVNTDRRYMLISKQDSDPKLFPKSSHPEDGREEETVSIPAIQLISWKTKIQ